MGWSVRWVLELIRTGKLKAQKLGKNYLIQEDSLAAYLKQRKPIGWQPGRPRKDA